MTVMRGLASIPISAILAFALAVPAFAQSQEQGPDGQGYIDNIHVLLEQTLAEYKEGNYAEAKRLAIEAYLDNYEHIEEDIEEDDPELMEKIELDLRDDLVRMINERRSAAEVESHISTIREDLEQARTVVVPEFSLAAGAVLAAVAAIVLAGTFYTRRRGMLPF